MANSLESCYLACKQAQFRLAREFGRSAPWNSFLPVSFCTLFARELSRQYSPGAPNDGLLLNILKRVFSLYTVLVECPEMNSKGR